jgi:hypothetical protein
MKKNFILIASLALFANVATAASHEAVAPDLPALVVTVSRQTDAERAVEASLAEFRQSARITPVIDARPALPQREVAASDSRKIAPVAATPAPTTLVTVKA